jgi:hypothetical protein
VLVVVICSHIRVVIQVVAEEGFDPRPTDYDRYCQIIYLIISVR